MTIDRGNWYGNDRYFGLHYDLHATEQDTELGTEADPDALAAALKLMGPQFVQTDCKGHPGYTSWFSRTPGAAVPSKLSADALAGWREATRRLGLPLHCHYSGIWDKAAGTRHPDWAVVTKDGQQGGAPFGQNAGAPTPERMCPRGDYVDAFMIPQMLELIDRYGVDGFWIDGDLWAVAPCYCPKCRAEFTRRTGIAEPPKEPAEPAWPQWMQFVRDSFNEYATHYCDAVHAHKKGVLVCSNWLQTFKNPGAPTVPTDWISGDNAAIFGMDSSRCEARFISTRGKHWDIMLWSFYCSHGMGEASSPWVFKPVQMLQQEAAVTLAFGGALQIYEHPTPVRSGRLVPWRMKAMGEVGRFVKARRSLCQDTQSLPQAAVLHSEHHAWKHVNGPNLMWNLDVSPVQGATFALLENHYGVDILDEWALLSRVSEFPFIVAPEQTDMSAEMVEALRQYVSDGGKLLVTGAGAIERFGEEFLGVRARDTAAKATFHLPVCGPGRRTAGGGRGQATGSAPAYSKNWALLECTTAKPFGLLAKSSLLDDRLTGDPVYTVNTVGRGQVAYAPFDLFRSFDRNRYPRIRQFIGEVVRELAGKLAVRALAPTCADVVLRQKAGRKIVHFINRASGLPNTPTNGAVDEIPPVGPIQLEMDLPAKPRSVRLAFEKGKLKSKYTARKKGGTLTVVLDQVHIHAAVVVEG